MSARKTIGVSIAVLGLISAGCGGSANVGTPRQQVTSAYNAAIAAANRGDNQAFKSSMTLHAQMFVSAHGGVPQLVARLKAAKQVLVSVTVHGNSATLLIRNADGSTANAAWIQTGNGWKSEISPNLA
jgi:hypothetical protein